ncbi:MAG TPA: (2Fe-2S) ferredoxin domain-containing protein [Bacillota bacterium]|jgi:NADP-reducing hydrogenase subunit HndB|nr:(2Fe-2S) ferredoxin domain-containing protein [Bacillota bacterium]HPT67960.1 (2Fe-2S) ferredoxin domain-containing protein [Bacillota bacterium]
MKSLEELARIREQAKQNLQLRESRDGIKIVVGMGTCGIAAGARETMNAILDELNKRNLSQVIVTQTGCVGLCEQEPIIDVTLPDQPKVTYGKVSPDKARQIIANHVVNGNIIGEWVIRSDKQ